MTNISNLGSSLASLGTQYNFKKMTNDQFLTAVQNLESQGKISQPAADRLAAVAQGVDSVSMSRATGGSTPSVAQVLNDPAFHDFIAEIQADGRGVQATGNGIALYNEMLNSLETNQGTAVEATSQTKSVTV